MWTMAALSYLTCDDKKKNIEKFLYFLKSAFKYQLIFQLPESNYHKLLNNFRHFPVLF